MRRDVWLAIEAVTASTWPEFAAMVERHNGVWGGCWCLEFHPEGKERGVWIALPVAAMKKHRTSAGQAGRQWRVALQRVLGALAQGLALRSP